MGKRMKYIVLGGNGFIGKNLCKYLSGKGCHVTSFDHVFDGSLRNCGVEYIEGDFFDEADLKAAIEDKDIIIHAISTINPGNSNELFLQGYSKDFIQTIKMCSWMKGTDKMLVFLSSGGTVYGDHDEEYLTEDLIPKPINHYANIKLSIENALRVFDLQEHLKVIIARISNAYGPWQDFTKGVGFIDAVLKQSMKGEAIEIWGDGSTIRDYIYIEDVCKIIYSLIQCKSEHRIFNISSGIGVSQKEILEIVEALGIPLNIHYKPKRKVDVKRVVLDNSRMREACNVEVQSIADGIKKYYTYLSEKG